MGIDRNRLEDKNYLVLNSAKSLFIDGRHRPPPKYLSLFLTSSLVKD